MALQIVRVLPKALLQNVGVNERIHVVCSDDCGEPVAMIFAQEPIEHGQAEIIDSVASKATGIA